MKYRNILLVEDNPSDIALTQRAFRKSRIANPLVVVEDGLSAVQYLFGDAASGQDASTELPAMVLLDLKIPIIDGLSVLSRIRSDERTRRLPVVILTSSVEEQDLAAGYDLGVNSYIRKPVDFEQFLVVMETLGFYWLVLNEPPPELRTE